MIRVEHRDMGWELTFQRGHEGGFRHIVTDVFPRAEFAAHAGARRLWGLDSESCGISLEECREAALRAIGAAIL